MQNEKKKYTKNVKQTVGKKIEKMKQYLVNNNNMVEVCLNRKWDWVGYLARNGDNWVTKQLFGN